MKNPGNHLNLTVGEVARRTNLTVRTLHHYDAIGLVQPSGRSASGYRLYNGSDIERLHAVLSLKQLGLSLEAIGAALAGNGMVPLELIEQQITEAARAMEQAKQLKEQLQLLRDALAHGGDDAETSDALLAGTRLLATYQRFLPGHAIRKLLSRWRQARPRWEPVATALKRCQVAGLPVATPEVQRLAQQWMNVAMAVFGGQLTAVLQWAQMHRLAPDTAAHAGLPPELLAYLELAIAARMEALQRHLSTDDLAQLDGSLGPEWEQFAKEGEALLAAGTQPDTPEAIALRARYMELLSRTVGHNAVLAAKMQQAYSAEPLLAHGHFVSPALRAYLARIKA